MRVRLAGDKARLTIKKRVKGATRLEFEYEIPVDEASSLIDNVCVGPVVEKTRHILKHDGLIWEIDVFTGDNEGLVVAEVELGSEDQSFDLPVWAGKEVTHDSRYYNASLVAHPFKKWASAKA